MRLFIGSIAILMIAGCASPPQHSTASAPAASVAPDASPAAPAIAEAAASGGTAPATADKKYPGYTTKKRNGATVYCKKMARIGSNFAEETCLTRADMEALYDKAEQDREAFRRNQTLCGTGGCGGS